MFSNVRQAIEYTAGYLVWPDTGYPVPVSVIVSLKTKSVVLWKNTNTLTLIRVALEKKL